MNITELAVEKSPRTIETVTAVASSTATESLPCSSALIPSRMYLIEWQTASAVVSGRGKKSLENHAADDRPGELVLKLAVQCAGGVVRHEVHGLGLVKGKCGQCPDERGAVRAVGDHGVLRAVKDRDLSHAVDMSRR